MATTAQAGSDDPLLAPPAPTPEDIKQLLAAIDSTPAKRVTIIYPTRTIAEPGQRIPKADGIEEPTLVLPAEVTRPSARYFVVFIDPDAPAQYGTIMHWAQSGFVAGEDGKLASSDPFLFNHRGPGARPNGPPHRYAFFVYEEPQGFDVAKWAPPAGEMVPIEPRMHLDVTAYENKMGLGAMLAGNYYFSN